jgi:DNA polymerase III sliding clamp (beta) subunit (PCNA family)
MRGPNVVTVSRAGRQSLARFAAVATRASAHVSLCWNADGLHLSTPDDGSEDCLAADVEGEAETVVQIRYLAELIGALRGDSVRLSEDGFGSPILVTDPEDENFTAVQMPMLRPRRS